MSIIDQFDLTGRVAVVTGSGQGIGRAIAWGLADAGCDVVLNARRIDDLEVTADGVRERGRDALIVAGDIRDLSEELADRTMERFGRIDIWVNNAMVTVLSPVAQMSAEEYRRVTEVTYLGTVHGTLAALKHMRARNRGTIVQVGSALAYRAIPLQSAYCAAKFACRGFTDSLRVELLHGGSAIHLTTVHLSAFNTPQFDWARNRLPNRAQPVPPIFQPEVAAEGIVWAAGQRRREMPVQLRQLPLPGDKDRAFDRYFAFQKGRGFG